MIGTSDQSCWLAEAYKILLLLLLISPQKNALPLAGGQHQRVTSAALVLRKLPQPPTTCMIC